MRTSTRVAAGKRVVTGPTDEFVTTPQAARPVVAWGVVGAVMLGFGALTMLRWLIGSDPVSTPPGPSSIPGWMKAGINVGQVTGPAAALVVIYLLLVRPWRRTGQLTTDGCFCLAFLTIWWQDPLINYGQPIFAYNTYFWNMGSWLDNFPGALWPTAERFAEPLLFTGPSYVWAILLGIVAANALLTRIRAARPSYGTVRLMAGTYVAVFLLYVSLEVIFSWAGWFSHTAVVDGWALFAGHRYQIPLYEPLIWSGVWTGWVALRFFTDDRGRTWAERGADRVSPRWRGPARCLAIAGIINASFMIYNFPMALISLHAGPPPADLLNRSYMMSQLCGPGTDYACPSPETPIPR